MSIPRKVIDWQAYDKHHQEGGTDAAFARSYGISPSNFPKYKNARHPDEITIVDMAVETVDLTPPTPQPQVKKIPIALLILDAGTQMRESLNLFTISEYAEAMTEGATFPPIIVFSDGDKNWLADGFQRVRAVEKIGDPEGDPEIDAEVRPGSLRDAILFAAGANATHGKRRTDPDKRKAVLSLMNDPEWALWSDNHIAATCRVSQSFASEVRRSLSAVLSDVPKKRQYINRHGRKSTMNTGNIGRRATGERQAPEREIFPSPEESAAETPVSDNGVSHTPEPMSVEADPPSRELFITLPPPATAPHPDSWLPQLCNEALAELQHLSNAANLEGYREYHDLHETLTALQEAIGREVNGDA